MSDHTPSYRQSRGQFPPAQHLAHKRVMLYGLTANPPTGDGGHRGIVKHIAKLQICDEIWVLPVFRHIYASKASAVDFDHRLRMCELNFKFRVEVDEHGGLERLTPVVVLDLEKTLHEQEADAWRQTTAPKALGTIDLVLALQARYPETHFCFLLGSDAFSDLLLGKWKESEQLLDLLEFHVAVRPGCDIVDMRKVPPPPKCNIHVIPGLTDISSSYVRRHTSSRRAQQEMHPPVYDYIREHKLFGFSSSAQIRLMLWRALSAVFTVGTFAYSMYRYRRMLTAQGASSAVKSGTEARDASSAAIKSITGKVGGLVKKVLSQGGSSD